MTVRTVLITRPLPQAADLAQACERFDFKTISLPMLAIEPLRNENASAIFARIDQFNKIIFISPNAVHCSLEQIKACHAMPVGTIVSMGSGTTKALADYGWPVHIQPNERFNSESLLALPEMMDVSGERIALIAGEAGRDLLAKTLAQRGAQVELAVCYRAVAPSDTQLPDLSQVTDVVITSANALANFKKFLVQFEQNHLLQARLIVSSERLLQLAKKAGFGTLMLAKNASISAITETLNGINDDRRDKTN